MEEVQAIFSNTQDDIDDNGGFFDASRALKAYLIENNNSYLPQIPGYSDWTPLEDVRNWYSAYNIDNPHQYVIYDNSLGRVGILYTMLKVKNIDGFVDKWISQTPNLDHCWLSKKQLMSFSCREDWFEKGIGLRYRNILGKFNKKEDTPTLSLKAWYGSGTADDWKTILTPIKEEAALSSIRWQRLNDYSESQLTTEWYNYGKVTVNFAEDVTEAMREISAMAYNYYTSLVEVEKERDRKLCAFELGFSKTIDLEAFSKYVVSGRSNLKLWMVETEVYHDFRRFRGVDLHTWDPIYLDISTDYAYLTVPQKSCVNAAPRIAVIQSENTAGNTTIEFDGVSVF